jgi:two-component system, OmpR family, response regulator MprA
MLLVADDDYAIRESLRLAIEDEGFQVRTAADGLEALEMMIAEPPCAVLLDLMMPRMTGWQVFDRMKADPVLAEVPVCIITAVPNNLPKNAVAILKKPVVLDDVLRFVTRHC